MFEWVCHPQSPIRNGEGHRAKPATSAVRYWLKGASIRIQRERIGHEPRGVLPAMVAEARASGASLKPLSPPVPQAGRRFFSHARVGHPSGRRGRRLAIRSTDGRCRPNPRNVLAEAHALVRLRLKEIGLEVPHLVVAVTPDGEVVLRSNVGPDVLRSLGEDLKNIADELEATPEPGDTTH
jgi:hypothetical protein